MKIFYLIILSAIILQGCARIYFSEIQPQKGKILQSFPTQFQGAYEINFSKDKNKDTIYIKDDHYLYPETFEKYIPMSKVDSLKSIRIIDNLLYDNSIPEKRGINYSITNDTLHYRVKVKVAKYLSDSLILKKYGKYLVINKREAGEKYWNVYLIKKKKNNLKFFKIGDFKTNTIYDRKIRYDGKLEDFYVITDFEQINRSEYLISPNNQEFEKLIK